MPVRRNLKIRIILTNHKSAQYFQIHSLLFCDCWKISVALAFWQTVVQKYDRAKARCFLLMFCLNTNWVVFDIRLKFEDLMSPIISSEMKHHYFCIIIQLQH